MVDESWYSQKNVTALEKPYNKVKVKETRNVDLEKKK